jgi:inositol phosphorylceramide mannosyltransferase catalytic subunit
MFTVIKKIKKTIVLSLFLHVMIMLHAAQPLGIATYFIDFEASLSAGLRPDSLQNMILQKPQAAYVPVLRKLYETNNFLTKQGKPPLQQTIPRIIHQIWLGSPLPSRYKKFQESWVKHHPGWEYRLWTDADVPSLQLINQKAFDAGRTYAEKANILRYEILERFGGMYVDTDFECLQPFDVFHDYYEFYTGMVSANRETLINNALIATIPHHPILKECVENIGKTDLGDRQMCKNGTIYFGHIVVQACQKPTFDTTRIIVLPPTYFYPWPQEHGVSKEAHHYFLPSSFAVHYWDCTWSSYRKRFVSKLLSDKC